MPGTQQADVRMITKKAEGLVTRAQALIDRAVPQGRTGMKAWEQEHLLCIKAKIDSFLKSYRRGEE